MTLSVVSTIIGGGIASVPYAFTVAGLGTSILVNIIIIAIVMFCTHLYLVSAKEKMLHSFSELCYVTFGRSSIFLINGLIAFVIYGILTLFFILFSRICISIAEEISQKKDESSVFQNKAFYIIGLSVLLLYFFLAREMRALNCNSYILTAGIFILLSALIHKNFAQDNHKVQ